MSLNPQPKLNHPDTYEYTEHGAKDWELLIKNMPRRFDVTGQIDPKGGLVDILVVKESATRATIRLVQFRRRDPDDNRKYRKITPMVYNGKKWVRAGDYVRKKTCDWCMGRPYLMDRAAGHMPDTNADNRHVGRFPIIAFDSDD